MEHWEFNYLLSTNRRNQLDILVRFGSCIRPIPCLAFSNALARRISQRLSRIKLAYLELLAAQISLNAKKHAFAIYLYLARRGVSLQPGRIGWCARCVPVTLAISSHNTTNL